MVQGVFERFEHDHEFRSEGASTHVRDVFDYTSPLGVLGRIADAILVERHMRRFLQHRMTQLKQAAETDAWMAFLPAAQDE